jgi:hypothetical protein
MMHNDHSVPPPLRLAFASGGVRASYSRRQPEIRPFFLLPFGFLFLPFSACSLLFTRRRFPFQTLAAFRAF